MDSLILRSKTVRGMIPDKQSLEKQIQQSPPLVHMTY